MSLEESTFATVTFAEIRDKVKDHFYFTGTEWDKTISTYIMDANRDLKTYKKVVDCKQTLTICDSLAELPCNYKEINFLVLPCDAVIPNGNNWRAHQPFVYSPHTYNGDYNFNSMGWAGNRFTINPQGCEGMIHFGDCFIGDKVDIYYDGYRCDAQGAPILMQSHQRYYENYCKYAVYARMENWKGMAVWENKYQSSRRGLINNENVDLLDLDQANITALWNEIGAQGFYGGYGFNYNWKFVSSPNPVQA